MPADLDKLLECALATANASGMHALNNWSRRTEAVHLAQHDVKLKLDIESQGKAEEVIRSFFPDHHILGEEDKTPRDGSDDEITWVVDPIDGTVNFSHGLPQWCTSIAAVRGGETLAGVVYAPALNELFEATADSPSLLNKKPIHVSVVAEIGLGIVVTGLDHNEDRNLESLELFSTIADMAQKTRVMGAAAIDLCNVACGRVDAYFEIGIYVWDIAAGRLIIKQAGGEIELLKSFPDRRISFMASNGLVHEELGAAMRPIVARTEITSQKSEV